jgi:hypothetical protein
MLSVLHDFSNTLRIGLFPCCMDIASVTIDTIDRIEMTTMASPFVRREAVELTFI